MRIFPRDNYQAILPILKELPLNTLFARAVLEDKAEGVVYTDDLICPRTFYILNNYGMSLLFGDSSQEEFNRELALYMLNKNQQRRSFELLQVYPEAFELKLSELLGDNILNYSIAKKNSDVLDINSFIEGAKGSKIILWTRVNFQYRGRKNTYDWEHINEKYTIKRIDSKIYDKIAGSVIPQHFWRTKEMFLSEGAGFAILNEEELVSIAFSSCVFDNLLEIGVETSDNYRGQGFGKEVCQRLINYCFENGYTPIWACRGENIGSYRLAKSLGFEEKLVLPYYELITG